MNLKKLFASALSVLMLASLVPTTVLGAGSYSEELQGAYEYAFDNGITTMDSIETANMYGSLTRVALAKMMANFAMTVLDKDPDTSKDCTFSDVTEALDAQYDMGVTNACQLGLMGVDITKFRPYDVVTRAEFGTVLSRALRGEEYNGATPYYADHLNALKDAGIMNNISNPSAPEVRGYVMLMMQRADEGGVATPAICQDPMVQIACALNQEDPSCPVECRDTEDDEEEVKSGDLTLSLGSNTPSNMTSIPQNGIVTFAEMKFKADSDNVKVNSITVQRLGLGQRADIDRVYFEKDGMRVSGRSSLSTDNTAVISFSPALEVKNNSTETLEFVVNVAATTAGGEHAFRVIGVNSSAADQSYNITTPTLRTSNYQVGKVEFTKLGSPQSVRAGEENVELGQFRLNNTSADNKELKAKAITLRQNESADLKNLSDLAIYRDGDKVSTDVMVNGKEVTFALNAKLTDGQSSIFYIRGTVDFVDNAGEKYQFNLRNAEDLNVAEYTTSFRAAVKSASDAVFTSTLLDVYTAEGADVMLSRDSSISSSIQVTPGSIDTVVLKGTIKANEAISLEDLTLTVTPGVLADSLSATITKLTLKVGNSTSTWTPTTATGVQNATFDGTFNVNGTVNVTILADIKSTATDNKTFQIQTLDLTKFTVREYVATQNIIDTNSVAGNITAPLATVSASKLNVTRTDGLSNRSVVKGANNVLLGKVRFTTQNAGSVRLSSLTLTNANTLYNNKLNVTMYINGTAVSTRNLTSPTLTFSSLPSTSTVTTAAPLDIEFRGNIDQTVTGGSLLSLTLSGIQATDNNSQTVTANPLGLSFATITATAGGTVSFSTNSNTPGASLLAAGTTGVEIAKFNVNATDDNLKLTDIYLAVEGTTSTVDLGQRLSNIQLLDGETVLANGVILDGGDAVGFENMSSSNFVVTAGNAKTLSVKATVNNVLNTGDVSGTDGMLQLKIAQPSTPTVGTLSGARFISESNGNIVTPATEGLVISNLHKIVRGKVLVASTATTATESRLLNFAIAAEGNRTTFEQIDFTLRNNASSTATVNLYKNSVSTANLLGSVTTTGGTGVANADTLSISSFSEEIAAGSTANYILEIVGYTPSAIGTNLLSRQFQIDDVVYGDIFNNGTVMVASLFDYVNAGNFPLTAPSYSQ